MSSCNGPSTRGDPEFERAIAPVLKMVHQGFRKNAVLVRLAAGVLQIRRHARHDRIERLITDDENQAYAYLLEDPGMTSRH